MILLPLLIVINLVYPISELGNCQSRADCRAFCSFSVNQEVCTNYGKKMGLVKEGSVLAQVTMNYPIAELGNCSSKQACKAYCNVEANYQACTSFAKSRGIIKTPSSTPRSFSEGGPTPTEIEKPNEERLGNLKFPISELGNCNSAQVCKNFCDQPANRQACFEFGRKQGLTGDQEAGGKLGGLKFPIAELGGCENFAACEAYCDQPGHRQTCSNYAKAHGFEPPKDKRGPGGCTSDEECKKFCQANPTNEECAKGRDDYCKANPDKCEKGPGGCTSDDECKKYCQNNPTNAECQKGKEEYCQKNPDKCQEQKGPGGCQSDAECRSFCEKNPDNQECKKGQEKYCQDHPKECEDLKNGPDKGGGPGGCKTDAECQKFCIDNPTNTECQKASQKYCQEHPEDCKPKDEKGGPGGCQTPDECTKYCSDPAHQAECQKGSPAP